MKVVYSDEHRRHVGGYELLNGELVPLHERPERLDMILERLDAAGFGERVAPRGFGPAPLLRVHDAGYLAFLREAHALWVAEEGDGPGIALPFAFPVAGLRRGMARLGPERFGTIHGKLGCYCFDSSAPFAAGTWAAIEASAAVALTGQALVAEGAHAAFALCRPPGHHAGPALAGGYCYVNNAAVAAQAALDAGAGRVAVLDVDYHHGNGTQAIFWERPELLFVSLHADPAHDYPYFSGFADETGAGAGEGCTLNLPLPLGTAWDGYGEALERACAAIRGYGPDLLVVSLGVDTFKDDPISRFRLERADYPRIGRAIGGLGRPTLFVMEGGYAVAEIGVNTVGVLTGFETAS